MYRTNIAVNTVLPMYVLTFEIRCVLTTCTNFSSDTPKLGTAQMQNTNAVQAKYSFPFIILLLSLRSWNVSTTFNMQRRDYIRLIVIAIEKID